MVASRNACNMQSNKQNSESSSTTTMINKSHKFKGIKGTTRPILTPLVIEKKYKQKAVPVSEPEQVEFKDEMVISFSQQTTSCFFVEDKIQTVGDSNHDDFIIVM